VAICVTASPHVLPLTNASTGWIEGFRFVPPICTMPYGKKKSGTGGLSAATLETAAAPRSNEKSSATVDRRLRRLIAGLLGTLLASFVVGIRWD
jgi:hypothetical protein